MAAWAVRLQLRDVPYRVREHAKNQIFSMLGAVHSGYASDLGNTLLQAFPRCGQGLARLIPTGTETGPIHAAALMSAWSMVLDYDDVMLGGHTGHSSVLVPFAFAGVCRLNGERLILAQIVANEIAARINMTVALGTVRGQMATHLHQIGAAAARAKAEALPAREFAQALAIAISYPAKALYPAFLGSDAKALCAAGPVRCGLEAVDAAMAGMRGNIHILEDDAGFLRGWSPCPRMEFLAGLGERWHTETNSCKVHPGSAYLQAAVEAVENIVARTGVSVGEVKTVDLFCPLLTTEMESRSRVYLRGCNSCVTTLGFSVRHAAACVLVFGRFGPDHLREKVRSNPEIWDIVNRIRIHHDPDLTIAALRAEIPIGAALANAGRLDRLRFLLHPGHSGRSSRVPLSHKLKIAWRLCAEPPRPVPADFSEMKKTLGTRAVLTLKNGNILEDFVKIPQGFAGSGGWQASRALMESKYIRCASENTGGAAARQAAVLIGGLEQLPPEDVDNLLRLNTMSETQAPVPARYLRR